MSLNTINQDQFKSFLNPRINDLQVDGNATFQDIVNLQGAQHGIATLVAGTVTVAAPEVTANSRIFISRRAVAGTPGFLYSFNLVPGSFDIISTNGADASTVNWAFFNV